MNTSFIKQLNKFQIFQAFQEHQEEVLWKLEGNVFAQLAAYRMIRRSLTKTGTIPTYCEICPRLRIGIGRPGVSRGRGSISGKTFGVICRRTLRALDRAAQSALLVLRPPSRVVFETDPEIERRRREAIYRRQVEELEKLESQINTPERTRCGPATRPVYCLTGERRWLASVSEAARFLSGAVGRDIKAKDIRTSISNGHKVAGWKFSYEGPMTGRPETMIILNGSQVRVRCSILRNPLPSLNAAAKFAGVSISALKTAIENRESVGGYRFEYCDAGASAATAPPTAEKVDEETNVAPAEMTPRHEQLLLAFRRCPGIAVNIDNFRAFTSRPRRKRKSIAKQPSLF